MSNLKEFNIRISEGNIMNAQKTQKRVLEFVKTNRFRIDKFMFDRETIDSHGIVMDLRVQENFAPAPKTGPEYQPVFREYTPAQRPGRMY